MSETVFISSVIGGFEAVRQAAREAVESMGMRPVMAEMAGARPQSPQHALLGEVADAGVYLLLLGARYGEPDSSGISPTEEEFEEAKRRNNFKPFRSARRELIRASANGSDGTVLARSGTRRRDGSLAPRLAWVGTVVHAADVVPRCRMSRASATRAEFVSFPNGRKYMENRGQLLWSPVNPAA
jgi:hypothetical protein